MVDPITLVAIGAGLVAIIGSIGLTAAMILSPPRTLPEDSNLRKRHSYPYSRTSFISSPMI